MIVDNINLALLESLNSTEDPQFQPWAETRLDRWLVDWALRNGREETARKITEEKGIGVSACFMRVFCYEYRSQ